MALQMGGGDSRVHLGGGTTAGFGGGWNSRVGLGGGTRAGFGGGGNRSGTTDGFGGGGNSRVGLGEGALRLGLEVEGTAGLVLQVALRLGLKVEGTAGLVSEAIAGQQVEGRSGGFAMINIPHVLVRVVNMRC